MQKILITGNMGYVGPVVAAHLRARFPNAQSLLLPGMFVTAQFSQAINTSAFLVPQSAVSRDPRGSATVWVVGPGNRAVQRVVVAERTLSPLLPVSNSVVLTVPPTSIKATIRLPVVFFTPGVPLATPYPASAR